MGRPSGIGERSTAAAALAEVVLTKGKASAAWAATGALRMSRAARSRFMVVPPNESPVSPAPRNRPWHGRRRPEQNLRNDRAEAENGRPGGLAADKKEGRAWGAPFRNHGRTVGGVRNRGSFPADHGP